jgi:hypothetical protein
MMPLSTERIPELMSKKQPGIVNDIGNSLKNLQKSGQLEAIVNQEIENSVRNLVKESLSFGAARQALRKKIDSALVIAIDNYDIGKDNISLDIMLQSVIDQTVIQDRATILANFKNIMTAPPNGPVNLETLLEAYKDWVNSRITINDIPDYEKDDCDEVEINLSAEIIYDDNSQFDRIAETATIAFNCDGPLVYEEDFQKAIRIWRINHAHPWHVDRTIFAGMSSLLYIDAFDALAMNLALSKNKITTDKDMAENTLVLNLDELPS